MNNFVVNTTEIDDDLADDYDSVYCTNCKSCGNWGCECWGGCSMLYCKYGPGLIEEYESMKKDIDTYYDMLVELGIECPMDIDLDRVKQIANKYFPFIDDTTPLKDAIYFHYKEIKDVEEEL